MSKKQPEPTPEIVLKDVWRPQEDEQITVNPKTKSRTIHTGLTYPDGSQGFIIMGRIGDEAWEPLKTVKQVIIEYENPTSTKKVSIQDGDSESGQS